MNNVRSFQVLTTLATQRFVCMATGVANTVIFPPNVPSLVIGITIDSVKDATNSIPVVLPGGIAKVLCNDTFSAGSLISSDSNGRAIPFTLALTSTSISAPASYAGMAIQGNELSTATAVVVECLIMPGYDRVSA